MKIKCRTNLKIAEMGCQSIELKAGVPFEFDLETQPRAFVRTIHSLLDSRLIEEHFDIPEEPKEKEVKQEIKEETTSTLEEPKEKKKSKRGPKKKEDK